jgi:hypothetical protein
VIRSRETGRRIEMVFVEQVSQGDPLSFKVTVKEKNGETHHQVTMNQSTYKKLTDGKITAECCIEAAFLFLLDHEPKESILSRFDVTVISRYFPSFEKDLFTYL